MSWPVRIATLSKGVGYALASLFANGADGLDFDFSKTDRLWQDNPPVNPADGAGEVIGLAYDAHAGAGPWCQNLLINSADLSQASWSKVGTPTVTATRVTRTTTAATYVSRSTLKPTAARTYTYQAKATLVAGRYLTVRLQGLYPSRAEVIFDLQTGVISTAAASVSGFSGASATIQPAGGGAYLITLTVTTDTHTNIDLSFSPFTSAGVGVDGVDSAAVASVDLTNQQLEPGAVATAYIATGSIPITLPGNQAVQATAGFKPAYQAAGAKFDASDDNLLTGYLAQAGANCIIAYVDVPATLAATQVVAGASGASANRVFVAFNTSGQLCAGVGSDSTTTVVGTTDWRGQTVVVALSFDGTTVNLYAGTASEYSAAQNSTPTTTIPFRIGALNNNGTAGSFCAHYVKRLLVARQALTLAQFKSIRSQLLAGG